MILNQESLMIESSYLKQNFTREQVKIIKIRLVKATRQGENITKRSLMQ